MYEQIGCSNKMNMSVDWSANLLRPIVQKIGTACTCEVGKIWPKINCPIISPNNANTQKVGHSPGFSSCLPHRV